MSHAHAVFPQGSTVLYDQNANDGGTASVSQDFETANDPFDNAAADDFVVPAGGWTVTGVDATGLYFNGAGPADSFSVTFYADAGGLPGAVVDTQSGLAYTDTTGFGSPSITLATPVELSAGVYWVSIVARMDFPVGGEWGWEDATVQAGAMSAWENPGDGFGSGCTTWTGKLTCIPTAGGPDFMYRLIGTTGGGGGGGFPPDENFDEVTAPALPSGWTAAQSGSGVPFVTATDAADSAPNSAYAPDNTSVGDMTLTSPPFTGAAGSVTFRHQYNLENFTTTAYDGAVLEISIGSGAFQDIVAAGGSFVTGGYNTTVSTGFSSPLAGRSAWSGNSGGFVDVEVTLPASAVGQTCQLRFRTADDSSAAATAPNGWWVDTIHVPSGGGGGSPVASITPASLNVAVAAGSSTTTPLNIANTGGGTLTWTMTEATALPMGGSTVLYDQNDNDGGTASVSQDFETANDPFDNASADDFVVPAGGWTITGIDATGLYFNGAGPSDSFSVTFYSDAGGLPGAVVNTQSGLSYTDTTGFGSPSITLATPVDLSAGTYWVSIVARMDFPVGGEWGWEDRTAQAGSMSAWENPGDGFGSGCTTWTGKLTCIPTAGGPDFMFRLNGTTGGTGGGCSDPSDVPWLSESPNSGSVAGGDSQDSTVTVDASSLAVGSYSAHICVATNDTAHAQVDVPVSATVTGGGDPTISVTPTSLSATQAPDTTTTQTLNIANVGGGALTWSIDEATPASAPKAAMRAAPKSGNSTASARGATTLNAALGHAVQPFTVVVPDGVPCGAGTDGIIIHDDGQAENGYGFFADSATEGRLVDEFTPTSYPATFTSVCLSFISTTGITSATMDIVVYADDGDAGGPGTELGSQSVTVPVETFTGLPFTPVFHSFDISGMGLNVTSGSVYIGVRWLPPSIGDGLFLASDESPTTPLGNGFFWSNADPWLTMPEAFPSYRSTMVRAVQGGGGTGGGCADPSDVPWLSESPTNGSTAGGASTPVTVTFDSNGVAAGSYSALLCVASNDAVNPTVEVPVSLTVAGSGDPTISVTPASLNASQAANTTTQQTLNIANVGGGALTWTIDEATPASVPKAAMRAAGGAKGASTQASGLPSYALWAQAGRPAFPTHAPGQYHAPTGSLSVYTTLGDFQGAVADPGALSSEDFEGGLTGAGGLNTCNEPVNSASNDVCFAPGDLVDGFSMTSSSGGGIVVLGDGFLGQSGTVIGANQFADTTNIAFSPAATAIAFDALDGTGPGPVTVTAFDGSGNVIGSADVVISDVSNNFIGLVSPVPVASVTLDGANGEGELINDMLFGDAGGGGGGGGCADPSDVPWLSESPTNGSTAGGASTPVTVTFNSTGLATGNYSALLCVASNDAVNPVVEVPVSLAVSGGGTCTFPPDENFDEVTAPALPGCWTTAAAGLGVPFVTATDASDTAPNSAWAPDIAGDGTLTSDMTLDSPVFTPTAGQVLSFRHQYNLESTYDGAVLEISVNGGAFQDIIAAGGHFETGGYDGPISTGFQSPIAGRNAWNGDSGGFKTTVVDLPASSIGQSAVLRFRTADDISVNADPPNGWWIDTIHLGAAAGPPIASITPASLSFTVAADATASDTLTVANTAAAGAQALTFSITAREVAGQPVLRPHVETTERNSRSMHHALQNGKPAPQGAGPTLRFQGSGVLGHTARPAPWAPVGPDGSVTFQADDGGYETAVSLNNQTTQFPAIWINRYSATQALTIDSISIDWPNSSTANGDVTGKSINLVAYYDADADGDPTNAVRLGTDTMITIGGPDAFETYPTAFSVPGAGDVYIGFVDAFASGGVSPILFAAALDENADPNVGWVAGKTTNEDPDLDNLANNDLIGTINDASGGTLPGAWMVRATGTNGGSGGPCTGPVITWMTASPSSGSVNAGSSQAVTVTVNPAAGGLDPGDYSAELCVTTNDTTHALVSVPVSVTVTAVVNDGIFCDGFEGGDGSCGGGGGGGTPGVYNDRDTFLANVAAGYFENPFDDVVPGPSDPLTYSEGGFTYTIGTQPGAASGLYNDVGVISTDNAADQIYITFATPVTAVGGNFWATDISVQPTGTSVVLTLSDGTVETVDVTDATTFRGFVTTTPITTLTIDAPDGGDGTPYWSTLDNLIVGSGQ